MFFASDSPLKTVKNPLIEVLSVEESEKRGLSFPSWFNKDKNKDRNEKILLYAPNQECLKEIEITEVKNFYYPKQYSKKQYYSCLSWRFSEERANQLKDYISEHLKTANELELWNIWLDDYENTPTINGCHIDDLTLWDIEEAVGEGRNPNCLIIYR